jgi:hypothetical protein
MDTLAKLSGNVVACQSGNCDETNADAKRKLAVRPIEQKIH